MQEPLRRVACNSCRGEGSRFVRPSKKVLAEYRLAVAAAAGGTLPARPPWRSMPCRECSAVGLVPGELTPPADSARSIAIVGGGIGGAAATLALRQRGLNAILYEKDGSFSERAQGYGLTMQQGANALRDLGLPNRGIFSVAHHSFLPCGTLIGSYGRAVHEKTRDTLGNGKGEAQRRNAHIPRQALRQALLDALPPEAVRWDKRLENIAVSSSGVEKGEHGGNGESGGGVTLTFSDGAVARADLAIGADGIWSSVRRQLLPGVADATPLRYLGVVVILGRAPCTHPLAHQQVFQTLDGKGTRIYAMPFAEGAAAEGAAADGALASGGTSDQADGVPLGGVTMWQLSFVASEEEAHAFPRDGPALLAEARRRVAGWHAPIEQLVGTTAPADVTGYPAYDREVPLALRAALSADPEDDALDDDAEQRVAATVADPADGLHNRPAPRAPDGAGLLPASCPVTLIGDAAHPMSPFKGQGANQALIDAVQLARAVTRSTLGGGKLSIAVALDSFERTMLRRVTPKVAASREAASALHEPSATAVCNGVRARAAMRKQDVDEEEDHEPTRTPHDELNNSEKRQK